MAKEREFSCTIAAPSIINFENHCICQCNVNGHFPIRHWLTLQASDHIPRKCEIWKHEDYHMNIQSILTSNGFLDISIHIRSCGCDFWKYLLLFSHTNSPKLTGLPIFGQFAHIPRFHSTFHQIKQNWHLTLSQDTSSNCVSSCQGVAWYEVSNQWCVRIWNLRESRALKNNLCFI